MAALALYPAPHTQSAPPKTEPITEKRVYRAPIAEAKKLGEPEAKTALAVKPDGCSLEYIKLKESTNNYRATNGQYTGAYQQSSGSWAKYGDGSAPTAGQASPASQDAAAARQYAAEGSRPWSVCH